MSYKPSNDLISIAERTIFTTYGDVASALKKGKGINKFGKNNDLDAGIEETIMTLQGSETGETYVSSNAITSVISDDAANTQAIVIEGHTIDGNGDFTFVTQTATLNGTTAVTLTTALARVSRAYNNDSTSLAANSKFYVYEGGTTTAGVPDTDSEIHIVVENSGENQSQKCATTISKDDYFILTRFSAGVARASGAGANIDFKLKIREKGGIFRVRAELQCSREQGDVERFFNPYVIVPKNADILITGTADTNNSLGFAAFDGHLAIITS